MREADRADEGLLPRAVYTKALETIEREYKVAHGRERLQPGTLEQGSGAHVSMLQLPALDPVEQRPPVDHDEAWPSTAAVRDRLFETITTALEQGQQTVVCAPTSAGKSYAVATTRWRASDVTDGKPVVQLHATREARDEAAAASAANDVDFTVLYGRDEVCPIAAGEHDPTAADEADPDVVITLDGVPASRVVTHLCEEKGVAFSVAHHWLAKHNDQERPLPCCPVHGDGTQASCPSQTQYAMVPRDREGEPTYDVIHATHQFAHVPGLRLGCHLIIDEEPDFTKELSQPQIEAACSAYLTAVGAPITTWAEYLSACRRYGNGYGRDDGTDFAREFHATREAIESEPDREWYLAHPDAHTLAKPILRAVRFAFAEGVDQNNRAHARVLHRPPRLNGGGDDPGWNQEVVHLVLNDQGTVQLLRVVPDMGRAASIVGLDAHPVMQTWNANVDTYAGPLTPTRVLSPAEQRRWRRHERGLHIVQVDEHTRPLTNPTYLNEAKEQAMIEHLVDHFGPERFRTLITAASVEATLAEFMHEAGVPEESLTTLHFGEEKSRNDFADETVGYVSGCIDPGDDYVLNLLAERGLEATPERTAEPCPSCTGDGCRVCLQTGYKRAHGRGFTGPDAEQAAAILASVRETHVVQAVGRYARRPAEETDAAVVFVHTDAIPAAFVDVQVPGPVWVYGEKQRDIVTALRDHDAPERGVPISDIVETVGCSRQHVHRTLTRLLELDVVTVRRNATETGADLYAWANSQAAMHGVVDLGEIREPAPADEYRVFDVEDDFESWANSTRTWEVTITGSDSAESVEEDLEGPATTEWTRQVGLDEFLSRGDP